MNITMYLAVGVAVCLCVTEGAPEARMTRKQQRPTRGFKNVEMMTARGFGKRAERWTYKKGGRNFAKKQLKYKIGWIYYDVKYDSLTFRPNARAMTAYGYGKRSGYDELNGEEEEIRVTRGTFKPKAKVLIARGFGKREEAVNPEDDEIREIRGSFKPNSNILIARGYGKREEGSGVYGMDNFWENLEASQDKDGQDAEDKTLQSIPLDWFTNELANNPDFARSVVRKFIDLNQDGILSSDELLRNV